MITYRGGEIFSAAGNYYEGGFNDPLGLRRNDLLSPLGYKMRSGFRSYLHYFIEYHSIIQFAPIAIVEL